MTEWLVGDYTHCYGWALLRTAVDLRAVYGDGVGHRSAGGERHRRVRGLAVPGAIASRQLSTATAARTAIALVITDATKALAASFLPASRLSERAQFWLSAPEYSIP